MIASGKAVVHTCSANLGIKGCDPPVRWLLRDENFATDNCGVGGLPKSASGVAIVVNLDMPRLSKHGARCDSRLALPAADPPDHRQTHI